MVRYDAVKKKGIVVHKTEVKDSDMMVACLGEEGRFSFYAKGVRKATSKNAPAINELTLGEFTLLSSALEGSGGYLLKEAAAIANFMKDGDFDAIAAENFLCELASRVYSEEEGEGKEFFPYLKTGLEAIQAGFDPFTVAFLCFAASLRLIGYGLDVDGCIRCQGKRNIVAVSYPDGGYVCQDCFEAEYDEKMDAYSLKILRYAFRYSPIDMTRVAFEKNALLPLFHSLESYFYEGIGYHLKTLQFLLRYAN